MSKLCVGAGQHMEEVQKVELWFWWAVWWLGLGILSSIGLGTGMHSGLLFLFPHMLKVILPPPRGPSCAGSHSLGRIWAAHLLKAGKELLLPSGFMPEATGLQEQAEHEQVKWILPCRSV